MEKYIKKTQTHQKTHWEIALTTKEKKWRLKYSLPPSEVVHDQDGPKLFVHVVLTNHCWLAHV